LKNTAQEIFAILQCVTASTSNLLLTSFLNWVRSHQLSEQNTPEEWRPQVHCSQSLKSHTTLQKHLI